MNASLAASGLMEDFGCVWTAEWRKFSRAVLFAKRIVSLSVCKFSFQCFGDESRWVGRTRYTFTPPSSYWCSTWRSLHRTQFDMIYVSQHLQHGWQSSRCHTHRRLHLLCLSSFRCLSLSDHLRHRHLHGAAHSRRRR